ncbi:hypothetical protein CWC21_21255 [Pseudoalteromonas phenolica]|nr:hypothetical protein CWC21_21255 [Pseudoalteromonas phenolica]
MRDIKSTPTIVQNTPCEARLLLRKVKCAILAAAMECSICSFVGRYLWRQFKNFVALKHNLQVIELSVV